MAWNPLDRLSTEQEATLRRFEELLLEFNQNVNLISREDEDAVFDRHILHCLGLTWKAFPTGSVVVDWGTGGGLPAIPLAIAFPKVLFVGVDAVGKKAQAVRVMARRLGLENVVAWRGRAEAFDGRADYSVSRAAAALPVLWSWHRRVAVPSSDRADSGLWRRGLLCLKGGDLTQEKRAISDCADIQEVHLDELYDDAYYAEKVILECEISDSRRREAQ